MSHNNNRNPLYKVRDYVRQTYVEKPFIFDFIRDEEIIKEEVYGSDLEIILDDNITDRFTRIYYKGKIILDERKGKK